MKKNIALIFGGKSGEHEVSIKTAFSILHHINYERYNVLPIYITKEGKWYQYHLLNESVSSMDALTSFETLSFVRDFYSLFEEIDIAFPVIHGPNGEDGTLQGFLEMMNVPYVGCGVLSSSLGMDKVMMKKFLSLEEIPQCEYLSFTKFEFEKNEDIFLDEIQTKLGLPVFVKPANLGSSIGISKVSKKEQLKDAILYAFSFDSKVIIEENITGRELEIGVLGNENLQTSVIGEIVTNSDFYDYESKYENEEVTKLIIPSVLPLDVAEKIEHIAKRVFTILECKGLSRIDFFYNEESGKIYLNEINTMPGFTSISMYPMLFKEKGLPYSSLIETLLHLAEENFKTKEEKEAYLKQKGAF